MFSHKIVSVIIAGALVIGGVVWVAHHSQTASDKGTGVQPLLVRSTSATQPSTARPSPDDPAIPGTGTRQRPPIPQPNAAARPRLDRKTPIPGSENALDSSMWTAGRNRSGFGPAESAFPTNSLPS